MVEGAFQMRTLVVAKNRKQYSNFCDITNTRMNYHTIYVESSYTLQGVIDINIIYLRGWEDRVDAEELSVFIKNLRAAKRIINEYELCRKLPSDFL